MSQETCPREDELLDALGRGYVGAELDEHVATCAPCSELRLVAGALLDDRAAAMTEAHIPASGTMWWRMRIRQRHDAQAAARTWLVAGQAITLIVALALLTVFFGDDVRYATQKIAATIKLSTPLLLAFGTFLLIAPIAGWVAIRQK